MNRLQIFWLAFITRPYWQRLVAQSVLIGICALIGYFSVIQPERMLSAAISQRIGLIAAESAQMAQRQATLPTLPALVQQIAALTTPPEKRQAEGVATQLLQPLTASGATLLSLQQQVNHASTTAAAEAPPGTAPVSPWLLAVNTTYSNAVVLLNQIMVMPQPLQIHSLTVSAQDARVQVEMTLSPPEPDSVWTHPRLMLSQAPFLRDPFQPLASDSCRDDPVAQWRFLGVIGSDAHWKGWLTTPQHAWLNVEVGDVVPDSPWRITHITRHEMALVNRVLVNRMIEEPCQTQVSNRRLLAPGAAQWVKDQGLAGRLLTESPLTESPFTEKGLP